MMMKENSTYLGWGYVGGCFLDIVGERSTLYTLMTHIKHEREQYNRYRAHHVIISQSYV